MGLFVRCQITWLSEAFVTVGKSANIRFFTSVSTKVCAEVEIKRESFLTQRTLERLLSSVNQLMPLKLWVIQEFFTASCHWTDVLPLTVRHRMLTKRWWVLEYFTTTEHMACLNSLRLLIVVLIFFLFRLRRHQDLSHLSFFLDFTFERAQRNSLFLLVLFLFFPNRFSFTFQTSFWEI